MPVVRRSGILLAVDEGMGRLSCNLTDVPAMP